MFSFSYSHYCLDVKPTHSKSYLQMFDPKKEWLTLTAGPAQALQTPLSHTSWERASKLIPIPNTGTVCLQSVLMQQLIPRSYPLKCDLTQ